MFDGLQGASDSCNEWVGHGPGRATQLGREMGSLCKNMVSDRGRIDKLSHIELTINCQENCLWAYLVATAINSARREADAEYYAAKREQEFPLPHPHLNKPIEAL